MSGQSQRFVNVRHHGFIHQNKIYTPHCPSLKHSVSVTLRELQGCHLLLLHWNICVSFSHRRHWSMNNHLSCCNLVVLMEHSYHSCHIMLKIMWIVLSESIWTSISSDWYIFSSSIAATCILFISDYVWINGYLNSNVT